MDLDLSSRMSTWFYIDSNGHEQGPFTSEEMVGWYQAGDLPTNLLLRRDIDSHFSRLDTFPRLFGFTPSDAGLPSRIPCSVSSSRSSFGATYGGVLGDHARVPLMNVSGPGAGYSWPTSEMQPARVPWMNGSSAGGAGYEASQPELPKDINVDILRKIKKAFNSTFRSGKDKEISADETESFQKAKIRIKEERIEIKEDLSEMSRNTKVKIKKEYIEQEIDSKILESVNVDFMGMIKEDRNMNFCVNNAEQIMKQETESFLITKKESKSHEAESPRNLKEENTETPRKAIKKPSQYDSNLVKVNGRRDRNVSNQYGSGKRKRVEHRPWKHRPKDDKIRVDKGISSSVTNKRSTSRSKSKSVNSYESDKRRKQGNTNPEWPFYEWKCPRVKCGGIIMRRSVVCIACQRVNPCTGVCRTEGCGQFNWISMMVCPKCHHLGWHDT